MLNLFFNSPYVPSIQSKMWANLNHFQLSRHLVWIKVRLKDLLWGALVWFIRVYQDLEGSRAHQDLLGLQAIQGYLWVHTHTPTHKLLLCCLHISLSLSSVLLFRYIKVCFGPHLLSCMCVIIVVIFQGKAGEDGKPGVPGKMVTAH